MLSNDLGLLLILAGAADREVSTILATLDEVMA